MGIFVNSLHKTKNPLAKLRRHFLPLHWMTGSTLTSILLLVGFFASLICSWHDVSIHLRLQKDNTFHAFNGHNGWFDKALTIVVTKDGMLGLNREVHSSLEEVEWRHVGAEAIRATCTQSDFATDSKMEGSGKCWAQSCSDMSAFLSLEVK
jgi:hypothetical protein